MNDVPSAGSQDHFDSKLIDGIGFIVGDGLAGGTIQAGRMWVYLFGPRSKGSRMNAMLVYFI